MWGLIFPPSPPPAIAAAGYRENLEHMAGLPLEPLHNNGDHRFLYTPAGGGGGGGKVGRRRVSKTRNAATPYERPSVGRHASAGPVQAAAVVANGVGGGDEAEEAPARRGGGGGAWLGVDLLGTASKLVTSGASLFYSSFFGRRQQQQQHEDATAPLSVTNNGDKNTGFCSLSLSVSLRFLFFIDKWLALHHKFCVPARVLWSGETGCCPFGRCRFSRSSSKGVYLGLFFCRQENL